MISSESFRNKRILVVAAHPDDELLGPGATMHRLIAGYEAETHVVILGEGLTSRSEKHDPDQWESEMAKHRDNVEQAQKSIGFHSVSLYDFPDNRFDSADLLDLVKTVEKEIDSFEPQIIFTHHGGDLNIDHQRTYQAVLTACRPMAESRIEALITFETPSATEWTTQDDPNPFRPNLFVQVSEEDLQAKINGMESYQFEKRPWPHPRSPKALKSRAEYWGSVCGRGLAEAFSMVRTIVS